MTKIDQNMPKSDFTVLFEAIFSEKTYGIVCPSVTRSLKKNKVDFEKVKSKLYENPPLATPFVGMYRKKPKFCKA